MDIEIFEKLKQTLPVQDYQWQNYNCEVAYFRGFDNKRDYPKDKLIAEFAKIYNNTNFTLKHPIHNEIETKAVKSFNLSVFYCVVMIDKDEKYPWILVANHSFADFLITPETIYLNFIAYKTIHNERWLCSFIRSVVPTVIAKGELKPRHFSYNPTNFCIDMFQDRPAHYFCDILGMFKYSDFNKPIQHRQYFFITRKMQKNLVEAHETLNIPLRPPYRFPNFEEMEFITNEALEQKDLPSYDYDYSLTLWIGIPGERRIWLEQWQGIPLILKNLSLYFPSIKVYVDGMTAYDGERIEVESNLQAFWKIVENTKEVFEVSDSASCKDAKQTAASLRGSVANEAIHSPLSSLRGEAEAIHNQAKSNFNNEITTGEIKDYRLPRDSNESLTMTKQLNSNESDIVDCHENQRFSRNDEVADAVVSRHCERSEAIHNVDNQKIRNGSRGNDRGDSKNSCVIYGARGEQIAFKSLSGYDYRTKICYCAMCDIVISETATTSLTPFYFCKKPGVAFYCVYQASNMTHINMARDFAKQIPHLKVLSPKYHAYERGGTRRDWCFNYHLPPEHLYNLAAESLEELSLEGKLKGYSIDNPLQMHRLPVPPVELYSKLYELEKKTQISLKGNKAEAEILKKIESQRKLLEMQNLLCESAQSSEIAPSTKEAPKPRGAKERVHHHLAYKLGMALIVCSKSLWGYITMPYVLSYIKAQHRFEQEKYQRAIDKNPALKLPKLESYADYEDALKEQQCYTYKLGAALMEADKTWLKGGYLWFYLESKRLKREFERERK